MILRKKNSPRSAGKLNLESLEVRRVLDGAGLGLDWGDAPDQNYHTLAANNGAVHIVDPTHFLGARVDAEPDGQPTPDAKGDDTNNLPDEDGVIFLTPLEPGQAATVEVIASFDGHLSAWADFNGNQQWDHPQEQIFASQFIAGGAHFLNFAVPAGATPGDTFSRWRFTESSEPLRPEGPGTSSGQVLPGEVEDYLNFIEDPTGGEGRDWGDAPDFAGGPSYRTLAANSGAYHVIDNLHFLGNEIDGEFDGQPSLNADRDDNVGPASDDEDGIKFLTPLVPGQLADVEVTANEDGFLSAWMDFNISGTWDQPAERIFNVQFVPIGTHVFQFMVPAGAQSGTTYSRWRFTDAQMQLEPWGTGNPNGEELPGEVEDYINEIEDQPGEQFDWGDAPDFPVGGGAYNTVAANNGAFHFIDGQTFLGNEIDAENDGQPNLVATGDDVAGPAADDEDGIQFLTPLIPGQFADVEVTANVDGFLNTWVDFNGNGMWDAAEQVFAALPVPAGVSVQTFFVPGGSVPGQTFTRFRFTNFQGPIGPAGSGVGAEVLPGEVEDYEVFIDEPQGEFDWGDAPDFPVGGGAYNTVAANNGAFHFIDGQTFLGNEIDAEPDGQPNLVATGDDVAGPAADDEDGIQFITPLIPGQFADVQVTANVDGFLNTWVDFNGNGMWDAAEQVFAAQFVPAGVSVQTFFVPGGSVPGQTFARFRFTNFQAPIGPAGSGVPGTVLRGEVEDYEVFIREEPQDEFDWGDAPDRPNGPFYQTLAANNGAFHIIDNIHFLGNEVDPEADGQPNLPATGDDLAGPASDDEDGVRFLTPIRPGQAARVEVTANADGFLSAWMDFNRNGMWDHPSEQIFSVLFLGPGTHLLSFNVPASAEPGGTYSRWRFTDVQTPLVPFGSGVTFGGINGEVEDYRNKIIGKGDFNGDGEYGCPDIDALVVEIASGANNPAFDLTGDLLVNTGDRDAWLAEAGAANLLSQNSYLLGDATLDGKVDGADFIIWNANKFTAQAAWCKGDFTANGLIDGPDFVLWNANKFMNAGPIVHEPGIEELDFDLVADDQMDVPNQPIPAPALPNYTRDSLYESDSDRDRSEPARVNRLDALFAGLADDLSF